MRKKDWIELDEKKFKEIFKDSAVERAGFEGLRRNILYANDLENNYPQR